MIKAAHILSEIPGATILVISRKEKIAAHLANMCRLAYETARRPGKPKVVTDNRQEFGVEGGGRLIVETASESAGRSFTSYWLLYDEFAFLPWQELMWKAAQPTISASGNVTLVSTPNGQGDEFERLFNKHADPARLQETGEIGLEESRWRIFRWPWQIHPQRDEAWKVRQLESLTRRDFAQEHDCDFLSSGEVIFQSKYLDQALERWPAVHNRAPGRVVLSLDVAGEGRDETVLTMLDCTAHPWSVIEQVAWEHISGPALQLEVEKRVEQYQAEAGLDYGGVGYGISQNLRCDHTRITFTGGQAVSGDSKHQRVPRDVMVSRAVQAFEHGQIALNPALRNLIRALQTARWQKLRGEFVDYLDSLLIGLWLAFRPEPTEFVVGSVQGSYQF